MLADTLAERLAEKVDMTTDSGPRHVRGPGSNLIAQLRNERPWLSGAPGFTLVP